MVQAKTMVQAKPIFGYWNVRAFNRGNVNRYILAYAEVDYEEKRYDFNNNREEWRERDKEGLGLDFANLPYIIDGDFKLTESRAVTVYICDRWCPALMGANIAERCRIIQLQQVIIDWVFGSDGFVIMGFQKKP